MQAAMGNRSDFRAPGASPHVLDLRPKFLSNRAKDVGRIREALDRGDYAAISVLGHNMRGNGTSYGFPEVSAIGERIEAAAAAMDAPSLRAQADEPHAYIEKVRTPADA